MKKTFMAFVAVTILMCACNSERGYNNYRGMSMGMSARQLVDSLQLQFPHLAIDTAKTGAASIVLVDTMARNFMVTVYQKNDTITDILEQYTATYNDSTTNLWQRLHDELQEEYGWPDMPKHGDLHKVATYDNDKGTVILTLHNTYSPTLSVRYSTETKEK
jgi:hypothetical protein